jgi:hypothetical protein
MLHHVDWHMVANVLDDIVSPSSGSDIARRWCNIPEVLNIDNQFVFMHHHLLGVRWWRVEADLSPPSNAEVQST